LYLTVQCPVGKACGQRCPEGKTTLLRTNLFGQRFLVICLRDFNDLLIDAMDLCNNESGGTRNGARDDEEQRFLRIIQELVVLPETYMALSNLITSRRANDGVYSNPYSRSQKWAMYDEFGEDNNDNPGSSGYPTEDADYANSKAQNNNNLLDDDEDGIGLGGEDDDWTPLDLDKLDELSQPRSQGRGCDVEDGVDQRALDEQVIADMVLHLQNDSHNPLNRSREISQVRNSSSQPALTSSSNGPTVGKFGNSNSTSLLPPINSKYRNKAGVQGQGKMSSQVTSDESNPRFGDDSTMELFDTDTVRYFQSFQDQVAKQKQKLFSMKMNNLGKDSAQASSMYDDEEDEDQEDREWLMDESDW
jgi:hypothetical protein